MTKMGGRAGNSKKSRDDQDLLTFWAAKMSTASIAALMGGRWTEDRVYNRLADLRAANPSAGGAIAPPPPPPVIVIAPPVVAAEPDPAGARRISVGLYLMVAGLVSLREVLAHRGEPVAPVEAVQSPPPSRPPTTPRPPVRPAPCRPPIKAPRPSMPPLRMTETSTAPAAASPPPPARKVDFSAVEDDVIRRCWREHPGHAASAACNVLSDRTLASIRSRAHALGLRQDGAARTEYSPPPMQSRQARRERPVRERPLMQVIKPLSPRVLRFARWFHVADWPTDEIADLFDLDVDQLALALGVNSMTAEAAA